MILVCFWGLLLSPLVVYFVAYEYGICTKFVSFSKNAISFSVMILVYTSYKIQEAEKHLSDMVVSKALVAKIDRPMGIVCFQSAKDSNDILNSWAANLDKLLDLVEKSCHQIHKETMVHKAALKV